MGKNQTSHMITMKVCAILGAMLVASASAVASDASIGYEKEMAALEPDEWAPKQQGGKEGATELIQEGATTKVQPSPSETAFSENAGENGPTSLFPGPTYGLPGYKESHDWLKDLDWWSPLVFDWRYYKARCADGCNGGDALKDMGEGAIKKYWVDTGMDNDDIASPTFDCEYYVMQNDELHEELLDEEKKVMCKKAVEHFLTSGVFDGLGGSTFDGLVVTEGSDSKSAWKISGNKCLNGCVEGQIKWDQNYAWTFWYKRTTDNFDAGNRKVLPVFAVRAAPGDGGRHNPTGTRNGGWWGGYPFFVTWMGSMMFCASTDKWECHWPIGEENSGVKGGWRFNWYHRWRLPPANWWRFYGVMADENGYTLYEFSDPPILGNSVIGPDIKIQSAHHANRNEMATAGKAHPELPYAVHGFSRRISTKSKGSWWGYDVHAPYHRPDGLWNRADREAADEILPETCTKAVCSVRCWNQGWHSNKQCRLDNTIEECIWCKEKDGKIMRDADRNSFTCKCVKDWDNIKKIGMSKFNDVDAKIWTGFTYASNQCPQCGWHWESLKETPQWIMDLTYYRLGDHIFSEEEMKALYEKGRSTSVE